MTHSFLHFFLQRTLANLRHSCPWFWVSSGFIYIFQNDQQPSTSFQRFTTNSHFYFLTPTNNQLFFFNFVFVASSSLPCPLSTTVKTFMSWFSCLLLAFLFSFSILCSLLHSFLLQINPRRTHSTSSAFFQQVVSASTKPTHPTEMHSFPTLQP